MDGLKYPLLISGLVLMAVLAWRYSTISQVLNQQITSLSSPIPSNYPTDQAIATESATPQASVVKIDQNQPTPTPMSNNPQITSSDNHSTWIYPNASIISQANNHLELTTNDSANQVTDWYKNKIKQLGWNTTSFVMTNTNDQVLNKLVGAQNNQQVNVEITKVAGSSTVKISLKFN